MAIKLFAAGAAQSVDSTGPIRVICAHLAGGSANSTAKLYSNGVAVAALGCVIAGNDDISPQSAPGISSLILAAPVTVDVVGTGAQLTLIW